jgi:hypothetical protein
MARCPYDHACMASITPERVIEAMEGRLAKAGHSDAAPG